MKTVLIILAIVLGIYFFSSDDKMEKVKAAGNVVASKSEMAVVDVAGKQEVILEMAEKRMESLRKRLIAVKSTKRMLKRKMEDSNLSTESKENYTKLMTSLEKCEKKGEQALTNGKMKLDELRVKLEMIDTEISIAKTSSSLIKDYDFSSNNSEVKKLIESLERELDNANAELDVAILETN